MFWWVVAILIAITAVQAAALLLQRRDHHFEKSAMAVQALATTIALMFAGYWYVYERKGLPQANTGLEVVGLKVDDANVVLEARFRVANLGQTLLRIGDTDVRLQRMNADSLPIGAIRDLGWQDFPATIGNVDAYDHGMLMWPTVKWFRGTRRHDIEPGESDIVAVEFVAPCTNSAMRIYFAIGRPGTDQKWIDQAMLSLSGLCAKPVGSKEIMSERRND